MLVFINQCAAILRKCRPQVVPRRLAARLLVILAGTRPAGQQLAWLAVAIACLDGVNPRRQGARAPAARLAFGARGVRTQEAGMATSFSSVPTHVLRTLTCSVCSVLPILLLSVCASRSAGGRTGKSGHTHAHARGRGLQASQLAVAIRADPCTCTEYGVRIPYV